MRLRDKNTGAAPAEWQAAEPLDPAAWIPLTELALHGFGNADTIDVRINNLRSSLADDVLLDDVGRPCVARGVARDMFAERAQAQLEDEAREAARRAEYAANDATPQLRARIRAIQAREATGDPLADMKRDDFEEGWERAAKNRDEIARGGMLYHSVRDEEQ